ncbi:DegT/DnrJ/EryC1/StrS family aminotransferase [Aquiluna sp.]|nr:DegT/DnrJ/EryC1/StrS family aminotransferase [Aquiluna sp.]
MAGPSIGWRERLEVQQVLRSGNLAMGSRVEAFEDKIASLLPDNFRVCAVNSGTSALHLGLTAMNLSSQDEVIVPAFTFAATANSVVMAGAKPVFADVDRATMTLSLEKILPQISDATRAIIFVSLFGNMSGLGPIRNFCDETGITLIEDAAQSFGSSHGGVYSGGIGDWSAFSFYPTKNITTGEGGAFVSRNRELLNTVKLLRNQGMSGAYEYVTPGLNNRMTEIAAAIGQCQVPRLSKFISRRQEIARAYSREFEGLGLVEIQEIEPLCKTSWNQFTFRFKGNRDLLLQELAQSGIAARVYYPAPLTELPHFSESRVEATNSKLLSGEVVSIPIYPGLSNFQVRLVANAVKAASKKLV